MDAPKALIHYIFKWGIEKFICTKAYACWMKQRMHACATGECVKKI